MTTEQFKYVMPFATKKALELFTEPLNQAMREYEINTKLRIAGFISQVAHESGSLQYVKELASGRDYEGRVALGNNQPGDGVKFKGRGLIQVTGRTNYTACSKALGMDFISKPELLELPEWAAKSAGWFWKSSRLNEIADGGDIKEITKRVNGGYNGLAERAVFYKRTLDILK
jgi:putative chitinase